MPFMRRVREDSYKLNFAVDDRQCDFLAIFIYAYTFNSFQDAYNPILPNHIYIYTHIFKRLLLKQ